MQRLAERLHRVGELSAALGAAPRPNAADLAALRRLVRGLVEEVAGLPGINACFACHDGLVLEAAGAGTNFEALSAMAQSFSSVGGKAADTLELGEVRQLLLIGQKRKLALLIAGSLSIGVLCPEEMHLASILARAGS